jgi:ribose 5-phosphate isomerase B
MKKTSVAIGADHGGFKLKDFLAGYLARSGFEVLDMGAHDDEPSDYPDLARAVSEAVASGRAERGIIVCGSGVGACVAANKFPGIRASVCHDTYTARQGVEHDDMNVLCLGGRVIGPELAREIVSKFLGAKFLGEEKYLKRLEKLRQIELEHMKKER